MKTYAVMSLILALATPAMAKDVKVYSRQAAEDMLDAPADADDAAAASGQCPDGEVAVADGCAATRSFSLGGARNSAASTGTGATASQGLVRPREAQRLPMGTRVKQPVTARRAARGTELPLQFALGSSQLSPQSMANLRTLAGALNSPQHSGKRIQITGHTDRSGNADTNLRLSQLRADTAAGYLSKQGVGRERIDAVGKGFEAPLPGVSEFSARQRRVEVKRIQ